MQVGKLTATNLDRRDNAVITYNLISLPPTWTSRRRSTTGSWCLGLTMVIVYVNVKDVNNNSPTSSQSDTANFEIGQLDGIIRTRRSLDREERSEYWVVVTARDQGSPPLSASMEITITVLDQNNNTPMF